MRMRIGVVGIGDAVDVVNVNRDVNGDVGGRVWELGVMVRVIVMCVVGLLGLFV